MQCFLIGCAHLFGLLGLYVLLSLLFKTHHPEMDDSSSSSPPQPPGAFPILSPPTPSPMPPTSPPLGSLPSPVPQPTAPILTSRSPELDAKIAEIASLKEQLRASRRENADLKNRRYNITESRAIARIVAAEKRADELTKQLRATSSLRAQLDSYKEALGASDRQRKAEQCVFRQSSERAAISHRQQIKALKISKGDKTESSKLIEKISDLQNDMRQLSKQNAGKVKALREEISAQQSTIDDLKARNEQLVDRINEPRQVDNTAAAAAQKDAEIDELKGKLLEDLKKSRESKKAQDEEISALKQANAKLQQDLRAVNVSTSNVNCERCTKNDCEISDLKAAHQKEIEDLQKLYTAKVEDFEKQEIDRVQKLYLQEVDNFNANQSNKMHALKNSHEIAINQLNAGNAELNEQLKHEKRLSSEANSKADQHEKTLQDVRNKAAALEQAYVAQGQALEKSQKEVKDATPLVLQKIKECAKAQDTAKKLEAQVYGLRLRCELAGISTDTDDNMTVDNNVDFGATNAATPGLNLTPHHIANVEMTDTNQNIHAFDPQLLNTQFPISHHQPLNPATSALMGPPMDEPMDTSSAPAQDNGDNLFEKLSNMQTLTPPNQSSSQPSNPFGSAFNQGPPSNPFAFDAQGSSTGGFTSGQGQACGNFNLGQGQQPSGGLQFGQTQISNPFTLNQDQPANAFTAARRLNSTRQQGTSRKSNIIKKPILPAPPAPTLPAPSAPPANPIPAPKPEQNESSYKKDATFSIPGLGSAPPSASSGPLRPLKKPSCPNPSARSANPAPAVPQDPSGYQKGTFQNSNFGPPPQSAFLNIVASAPRLKLQLPGSSNQQDDMETT